MSTPHASRAADVESAARIIAALRREAEIRAGSEQAVLWRQMADMLGRRWPQPPHHNVEGDVA